jgi:hypothetical protein
MILGLLLAACGPSTQSGSPSEGPASTSPSQTTSDAPSTDPGASDEPDVSSEPDPSETPSDSEEPSESPSDDPSAEPSDGASASPGSAEACTGTTDNQAFYVRVADAVAWTVFCPVLPAGWHVKSGSYRGAAGGRMEIGYDGPGSAAFTLQEGVFCTDDNGCVPSGTEQGTTAFGDRTGTLVAADDGSWVVVVDQGADPSWLLIGSGLDETEIRAIAADLVAVD